MSKIIKIVEYYDPIMIDSRYDTSGKPTGDEFAILLIKRFTVVESRSGNRTLKFENATITIRGKDDLDFGANLKAKIRGKKELPKKLADKPDLIRKFTPPELKPYLEKKFSYAK